MAPSPIEYDEYDIHEKPEYISEKYMWAFYILGLIIGFIIGIMFSKYC